MAISKTKSIKELSEEEVQNLQYNMARLASTRGGAARFANAIGVERSTVDSWVAGKNYPSRLAQRSMRLVYGVDPGFLLNEPLWFSGYVWGLKNARR